MTSSLVQAQMDGLLTFTDGQPHLLASHCSQCSTDTFPVSPSCPCCGGDALTPIALATRGFVWTWTVQRFQPKPPFRANGQFEPFAVGYVDLGTIRIEARLAGKPVDAWQIGDRVQLVVGALDPQSDWQAFWFEAVEVADVEAAGAL
jgi:uncharacterized protein